jgi:uncharacterized protein
MKLLLDTNIFTEVIFKRRQAVAARSLINSPHHALHITIFALHSVGLLLFRGGQSQLWRRFLNDLIISGQVQVLTLSHADLATVIRVAQRLSLDFDDAYQYIAAEANNLTLVSFDKDFDHTPRGRQTPQAILRFTPTP